MIRVTLGLSLLSFGVTTLAACGSTIFTPTGPKQPARAETCDIETFTAPPMRQYTELGTLDVESGAMSSHTYLRLEDFKEEVRPYVCRAGGDAVIALANGTGMYIKATVLKLGPAVAPADAAAAGPAGGCQYDTQCKGDRICVNGACASPPAPSATPAH